MTRRAYLYFTLTFVLGVIVGNAGLFIFAWYGGHWHRSFDKDHIVLYLKQELSLSDAQVQQLGPIVDDWMQKQSELHQKIDPQFQALREEFRDHVRRILNPAQQEKFNVQIRRHEERRKKQKSP